MNQIKNLSLFGICMAFVVIALGAWTRLVDAGLGCPDWPGCYGFVVFPINEAEIAIAESRYPTFPYDINKAIPEVVHRYFAAALGLLAIFLVYLSFRKTNDKSIQGWSCFLLIFICLQGTFGYLTVSLKLLPIIVTIHLFGGFTTLLLLYFIYLKSRNFEIFNQMGVINALTQHRFFIIPSQFKEDLDKTQFAKPQDYVLETATQKALALEKSLLLQNDKDLVVCADTIIVFKGIILEKPKDAADAKSVINIIAFILQSIL